MQVTKIPWATHVSNPVKGLCPVACKDNQGKKYCYARALYRRFGWDKTIRFCPEEMESWEKVPYFGSKIFVGSTIELFGEWVDDGWLEEIFFAIECHPWITFQILTKRPKELIRWSPFSPNCWVGITATNRWQYSSGISALWGIEAGVKFISFEPLLERIEVWDSGENWRAIGIKWVIIGGQTRPTVYPKIEWIEEIVTACDEAGIKVFLKDSLWPLFDGSQYSIPSWAFDKDSKLRQEMP